MLKKYSIYALLFCLTVTISCKQETSSSGELTEGEVKQLFDTLSLAKVIPTDSIPKYKKVDNSGLNPQGSTLNLEILSTDPLANCTIPTSISSLTGGFDFTVSKFDESKSAEAKAMGFTANLGKKELLFIEDYVRYTFVSCGNKRVKMGIGLRCYIHVTSIKGKFGGSLPAVAANVELDRANASFQLKGLGFGIDGEVLAKGLKSGSGSYNVENFGELAVTFNNVLNQLNDKNPALVSLVELP